MGKDDNLSLQSLSGKAFRHGFPMHMVERRYRVIKDDGRTAVRGGHFCQESGQGDAAMFALTQDFADFGVGLLYEADAEKRHALGSLFLTKLNGEPCHAEPVHFFGKLRPQGIRDKTFSDFRALRRHTIGRGIFQGVFQRRNLLEPPDFRNHVVVDSGKPCPIRPTRLVRL